MTKLKLETLNPVLAIFQSGQLYYGAPQLPGDQATFKISFVLVFQVS